MHRRIFLSALGVGAAWPLLEPTWFDLTRTRIALPGIRPGRILHISDIHISDGLGVHDFEPALKRGLAERPDLIFLTGDFVSWPRRFDRTGLRDLLRRAANTARTYAVLGNHDGLAASSPLPDLIESAGAHLLHNRAVLENDLAIIGLGDLWTHDLNAAQAFAAVPPSKARIVLCHNPDGKDQLARHAWDLMFSGHTHGGQAHIPGVHPFWTPVKDQRYIAGLYRWNNRQLFITRGLGSPKHIRAFCRPEISILEIG